MGLFSRLSPKSEELNEREAIAVILFLATVEDGKISDDEINSFKQTAIRLKLYSQDNPGSGEQLVNKFFNLLKAVGGPGVIDKAARAMSKESSETAFALATDRIFSNGQFDDGEKEFLELLQQKLGLSEDTAYKIAEVAIIKHRVP